MANFLEANTFNDNGIDNSIQKEWLFRVQFHLPALFDNLSRSSVTSAEKLLSYKAKSFTLPSLKTETLDIKFQDKTKRIPIEYSQEENFSITFEENDYKELYLIFSDWIKYIRSGEFERGEEFNQIVTEIELYTFNNSLNYHPYKMVMHDCFPQDIGNSEYSYSGNSIISHTVSFAFSEFDIYKVNKLNDKVLAAENVIKTIDTSVSHTVLENPALQTLAYQESILKERESLIFKSNAQKSAMNDQQKNIASIYKMKEGSN